MFDLNVSSNRPAKISTQNSDHIVRIRLQPQASGAVGMPLHLAIALDTSSSMQGDKLQQAIAACHRILSELRPEDSLSLASYSTQVQEIPANNRDAINSLTAKGITRTDLALEWLQSSLNNTDSCIRVAILITDGHATTLQGKRIDDVSPLLTQATQLKEQGIILHTVGLGNADDFNSGFLVGLCDRGSGNFIYADTPDNLTPQLKERLTASQSVISHTVNIQLKPLNGTKIESFCQFRPEYQPLEESQPNQLSLTAVRFDTPTDILVKLDAPPLEIGKPLGEYPVLDITLSNENQKVKQEQVSLLYTQSFKESQKTDKSVNQDGLCWEINLYSTELLRTNDPNATGELLTNIQVIAEKTGQIGLAKQAAEQLEDLNKTGKISLHKTTKILTQARQGGANNE